MKLRLRSEGQPELRRVSLFVRAALRALTVVGLPILVLAPFTVGSTATPARRPSPVVQAPRLPSRLPAGVSLHAGSFLTSPNGHYRLEMQANGDLVLAWGGHVLWTSRTAGHPGAVATMQADGNFVVYQHRRAIWDSRTSHAHKSRYYLLLQSDGDLVIYSPAHKLVWQTRPPVSENRLTHGPRRV